MTKRDLAEYKRKYQAYKHHAWAGLGFLSVFLAVRLILGVSAPDAPDILDPIIFLIILYIIIALLFTYRYRSGLSAKEEAVHTKEVANVQPSDEIEKEKIQAEVEKELLKLEKKKAKAEAKKAKKSKK